MRSDRRYWFAAKRYGWGWTPVTWEGWGVLLVFVLLIIAGSIVVLPRYGMLRFYACVAVLIAALTFVCWRTGEPPRWRWGDD